MVDSSPDAECHPDSYIQNDFKSADITTNERLAQAWALVLKAMIFGPELSHHDLMNLNEPKLSSIPL